MGLTMLDPDGKGWERLPDLVTNDEPPLSHEDQSLSRFPLWEGEES